MELTPPPGLGPWGTALWEVKQVAHASGKVTETETDQWAVHVGENNVGTWGTYDSNGEFVPFFPVGTPENFVRLAREVYSNG